MSSIEKYLFIPDEAYSFGEEFRKLAGIIRYYSADKNLESNKDVLAIETQEGVFVRVNSSEWCELFLELSKNKEVPLKIIGTDKWKGITRKYRAPINSFGDEKLAMWRVGF
ncbi:MAG TPA: hypothetical protein VGC75_06795 [Candidatus Nitrosocosmicus sp.]